MSFARKSLRASRVAAVVMAALVAVLAFAGVAWAGDAVLAVKYQDAVTGNQVTVKEFTAAELEEMAMEDVISAQNWARKPGTETVMSTVYTTKKSVPVSALIDAAGLPVYDVDTVQIGAADNNVSHTWADWNTQCFYPNAACTGQNRYDATGPIAVPVSVALECVKMNGGSAYAVAAHVEKVNLDGYDQASKDSMVLMCGISPEKFTSAYIDDVKVQGGKRFLSGINEIVVKSNVMWMPMKKDGLVYNGKVQQGTTCAALGVVASGVESAKNAGTYTATYTLKEGYAWSDGTTDPQVVKWSIARKGQVISCKTIVTKTYAAARSGAYKGKLRTTRTVPSLTKTFSIASVTSKSFAKSGVSVWSKAKNKYVASKTASAKVTVTKGGKVYVKKGLKKGTYKVAVKVSAAQSTNYKAVSKTIYLKVKVK
ncbi:MAG: hypothetical protein Q4D06_07080 [Coriobacteriia bacterium]|nr:hypothetical protein [Coriobacteriia bacterium]